MASKGNKFILEKFISNNQLQKAQEGTETTLPGGRDIKLRNPDGSIRIINTGSPEYIDMYNSGKIQSEKNIANDEWWGGKLEDVVIQREPTEFGKVRNDIKEKNTWEKYAQRYLGNFERRMGQTLQNLPEYRKQEYEDYINKLSFDEYVKTHPQAKGEDRGAYIDRIQAENAKSPNFGRAYEANAPYNDATDINKWRKFLVGLGSIMVPKPAMDYMKQNSDYYSTKEKQEMKDSPVLTQVGDIMGTLEPLTIPVEGLYGEKSFGDIASGESADIPMSMRILGDPLMPLFEAAPLLGAGFKTAGRLLGTEEGLLSNAWKLNSNAEKLNNANSSYRVAGLNAYEDFKNTGVLRSKTTLPENATFLDRVEARPTSFPSFQKGYADMAYAKPEGSVVFETALPTFKRGDINPVTGLPIKGRHYAHRVIDPATGKTMMEIPAADIRVFGDKPHWWKGYQQIEVPALTSLENAGIRTSIAPELREGLRTNGLSFTSSTNNVTNISKNLEDLNYAKKWAKQYGYELPKNLERIAQSDELTNRTIRGLANRHNTFVRGVSTNWDVIGQKSPGILRHLENKGFNLGTEEGSKAAAEYMATHIPFDTGYGRYGLKEGENALYLSNSFPTAEGYTYGQGYMVKAKRPTDFSSSNRQDWLTSNDFEPSFGFKGSPFGEGIVKNDYIKRFPTNIRETLAATGDPDKFTALQNVVRQKEKDYFDLAHASWKKHNNLIDDLRYKTDADFRRYRISDDPFVRDTPNFLDNLKLNYLQRKKDFMQKYYELAPLKDMAKGVYGDPDVWKALGKNLFSELDPFSHYAIKGQEGEKVLEALRSIKVNPETWKNTSRLHVNKYSNKLSRREDGGEYEEGGDTTIPYSDFQKYAMKEMGGMMYANKDAGLPHKQSVTKYLSAQNNLLDFMKRIKVVGGPVPFDEYYRENIINPRNKS
jgi:hypothetical protein